LDDPGLREALDADAASGDIDERGVGASDMSGLYEAIRYNADQ
jgi:hypothetical protein